MGDSDLERLRAEVLRLSDTERAELAHDLVKSLDEPADQDAAEAWDREVARRLDAIDAGTAKFIDREELRRRLQARLKHG
jgi:putative addiction module component (TIGR02574 family)